MIRGRLIVKYGKQSDLKNSKIRRLKIYLHKEKRIFHEIYEKQFQFLGISYTFWFNGNNSEKNLQTVFTWIRWNNIAILPSLSSYDINSKT